MNWSKGQVDFKYSVTGTYAIACPSDVDVPRPSSSSATNELRVADDCYQETLSQIELHLLHYNGYFNINMRISYNQRSQRNIEQLIPIYFLIISST